ncbi:MAG TPA: glycosyltransferase family 9 protein [Trueperaceae bacterium]
MVVVRALRGLGDMLCVVPALRALRAGLPRARITLLGLPEARSFVRRYSAYLDDFLEFPGFPGIPEKPVDARALPAFFRQVHDRHFDLALQMHGSGTFSNAFTVLLSARVTAGCYLDALSRPNPETFMPYRARESEVRRWLALMTFLGMPAAGEFLEFPIDSHDLQEFDALEEARDLPPGSYVCIHPGANEDRRRWSPHKFAAVGDGLAARGLQVVLTGSAGERMLAAETAEAMRARPLDLSGRTSLGVLAVLLAGARLLVSNDTGVSHLADALRLPSVVVFLASDPERWAPLDRARHRVVGLPAEGNARGDCPECDPASRCLVDACRRAQAAARVLDPAAVSVDDVLDQAASLLDTERPAPAGWKTNAIADTGGETS